MMHFSDKIREKVPSPNVAVWTLDFGRGFRKIGLRKLNDPIWGFNSRVSIVTKRFKFKLFGDRLVNFVLDARSHLTHVSV